MKKERIIYSILFLFSIGLLISPLFFRDFMKEVESLGLLGIFFINFFSSATLFLPSPGILSVAIGGSLYDPLTVALIASASSTLGEGVGFLFGFSSKKVLPLERHKILFHLLKFTFEKYGTIIIFLFSLIPNPLFDGIGILAGIAGFAGSKFLIYVFAGRLLRNIGIAFIGTLL